MKASVINQFGEPSVFEYVDVNLPELNAGEVRIKILAAGLNRLDHYLRLGNVNPDISFPHILGSDAAGVVEANGPGSSRFQIGERVIPLPGYPLEPEDDDFEPMTAAPSYLIRGVAEWGTYAEYMVVPEKWLVKDETGLAPELVATLPMPLVTCVRAIKRVGEVKPGDTVVIHGAASGTGSISVQVAKALGAKVIATIRTPEKESFVSSLGADLVIKTESENFVERIKDWTAGQGADVVLDNLGGRFLSDSLQVLKPQGILVSMGMVTGTETAFELFPFFLAQQQIRGTFMGNLQDLHWGLEQIKAGTIKPTLDRVYDLRKAQAAHTRLAAGAALGTLVLQP
ncbi:MAG: zinc-binding alcohol dehydrogenase family protein [Leptolyngbyaceae cyanobacterium SM1_1_3]|nr:zinc-binding alcohol dehydrogenase family protein [Leptolyngbyaceae cyanobacterium SM1_1_3]NJN01452.1 zinc-binding alcohol dehydrogenase family protein [Leptolyngbyaceae cyanobacterium RM1_1_2]NJO10793.1 zinc-binding alcohol dehydrogenase family protein [Leptolyngbyaceae cyanobacterium SL_1_1]